MALMTARSAAARRAALRAPNTSSLMPPERASFSVLPTSSMIAFSVPMSVVRFQSRPVRRDRPKRRHCEKRSRLTASCAIGQSGIERGAVNSAVAAVARSAEHAERLTQRIPHRRCVRLSVRRRALASQLPRASSSCPSDCEGSGPQAPALRSAAHRDRPLSDRHGRDKATAPASRSAAAARPARSPFHPSRWLAARTAPSSRPAARRTAPGEMARCVVATEARRFTAARATIRAAISAASTNATPARIRSRFDRNKRRSTSPNVSVGVSRMSDAPAGTSDSTRIGTGTSEYWVSRPASAAPP